MFVGSVYPIALSGAFKKGQISVQRAPLLLKVPTNFLSAYFWIFFGPF
jgi:hypothetical protein